MEQRRSRILRLLGDEISDKKEGEKMDNLEKMSNEEALVIKKPATEETLQSCEDALKRIPSISADCIAQYLRVFHEQSVHGKPAAFEEACTTCKHAKNCKLDWLKKWKPLLDQTDVTIRLCYPGHLRKEDNYQDQDTHRQGSNQTTFSRNLKM